jgi:WD40 repeat protein
LLFDNSGGNAYLGVDSTDFNQKGLMVFNGSTVAQVRKAPGKVLAISPDRNSTVISDTSDSPNLLFICANCGSTSQAVTTFQISGATAAAFSPDSLKAYILATPPPPAPQISTLYVYSKLDPLQPIQLTGHANDVAFHPEGGFAYVAGPSTSLTPYRNCDNTPISSATLNTPHSPLLIRPLPDGNTLLVLDPPDIDIVTVTSLTAVACTGAITDTTNSFDLGQGSFIPTQFFVSPDGSTAYILGNSSAGPPPSRIPFVMVFNVNTQTTSALSLSNSAAPLSASLSPDGKLLFVGADDGTLHVIDTTSGIDTQQVTFPFPTNELCFGPGNPLTQVPLSQVSISAVSQSGSTGAYTYTLISGAALKVGQSITVANMSTGGDNGTYTITGFGIDSHGNPTFLITNSNGASATNQSGTGTVPIACKPDLVAVRP